jgi:hypothetical protein
VNIAHHRAPQHRTGATAKRLYEARQNQHFDALGERTGDARQHEQCQPTQQHRLAAVAVRQGAIDDLRKRKSGEEQA